MSATAAPVAALVAALLVGTAGWLLVPGPVDATRLRGPVRRRTGSAGARRALRSLVPDREAEPSAVRVARAAAEVAALLRAGAVPSAAWAPQRTRSAAAGRTAGDRSGPLTATRTEHPVVADALPVLRERPADAVPDAVDAALDAAARAAAAGEDPAAALRDHPVADRTAASALGSLALAWRTSETTGAPAAAVLEGLAAALRDEAAATDVRDAALAGPRATARLLLALPPLGLAASTALGADPLAVLVGTPAGRWCAALGAAFALTGWAWTSALVRSAERAR